MLLMLCKIDGAAEYVQDALVILVTLFQTIQMIQLFRISSP